MQQLSLKLFDETLRDGEQQAGLFFSYDTKVKLANLIAKTGVHHIDIMPAVGETEEYLVKTLVTDGLGTLITPATMMSKNFVDQVKACGVERIILFHAVSDRLMFLRDPVHRGEFFQGKTIDDQIPDVVIRFVRQNMIGKVLETLRYATSPEVGLKVEFAAEDSSRANFDFLVQCIREFKPYLGHFMLCDTLGILTPDKTYEWVQNLLINTGHAPLAVHFHNDLGMALENTLQAIIAGASMVSGTFGGIGERAGNVALEQVLNGLRVLFGIELAGIDYDAVDVVTEYLSKMDIKPAPPYSRASQRHETGIHVNSLLQDPKSYCTFPHETAEIWFGKCSGSSNFQYLIEKIQNRIEKYAFSQNHYNQMRNRIKSLSIEQQRSFNSQEVIELLEQGVLHVYD